MIVALFFFFEIDASTLHPIWSIHAMTSLYALLDKINVSADHMKWLFFLNHIYRSFARHTLISVKYLSCYSRKLTKWVVINFNHERVSVELDMVSISFNSGMIKYSYDFDCMCGMMMATETSIDSVAATFYWYWSSSVADIKRC